MKIKCQNENCSNMIEVYAPNGEKVKYTCKEHLPKPEKDVNFQDHQFDNELSKTVKKGFEVFGASGGFQIITIEERASKETPVWAQTDKGIADLIRRVFPKFDSNAKQRFRASRWVRVIYLHFKLNYTLSQIADEMSISEVNVKNILNRARRVASGRTAGNVAVRRDPILTKSGETF